jgi:hypothetical protein
MLWKQPKRRPVLSKKLALDQRARLFDGKKDRWNSIRFWIDDDPCLLYLHIYKAKEYRLNRVMLTIDGINKLKDQLKIHCPEAMQDILSRKTRK